MSSAGSDGLANNGGLLPRVLGLDFGTVRVGVAISDPLGITAQVLPVLQQGPEIFTQISDLINEYEVRRLVLGSPKNQNGMDSDLSQLVRQFQAKIQDHNDIQIVYWDERFSSQAADRYLKDMPVSAAKKKSMKDSYAAAFILQGYLDSQ